MSGGHFDYVQYRIEQAANDVENYIMRCVGIDLSPSDFQPEHRPETIAKFRECEETLRLASKMLHRVDWLVSGDDGEDTFHNRWDKEVGK